ncbi:hypothetical protein MKK88_16065 [Methylobacterium sp. E-005]|uniref:glycosyltransferase family 2 protein n=1 Tax=Methylobacterium sp. E-005 TaxID=2836549 RepID=UPI001FB94AE7|nr:hypothetical protein [Methylobacterium sp. E-005]MCJ2087485.1 hypothetical protein [Methylobacterium sp. E-005]
MTYNQPKQLERLYASLRNSWGELNSNNLVIINNHSNFKTPGPSRVFHNALRPDGSIGYLSRSWNQCLIHGFGNSIAPRSDWVCLVQSDVVFQPGWRERFERAIAETGSRFVACGPGDQATFIHIEAFREIGWWDERFCGIGYQEFDYFVRAYIHLRDRASLQGHGPSMVHNWKDLNIIARQRENGSGHTSKLNPTLFAHLISKWGQEVCRHLETTDPALTSRWREVVDSYYTKSSMPKEYNWYPHFFIDDDTDYSILYKNYTPLKSNSLDIRTHGMESDYEQRPTTTARDLQLPINERLGQAIKRALGR